MKRAPCISRALAALLRRARQLRAEAGYPYEDVKLGPR
jgi:hypothetical protein